MPSHLHLALLASLLGGASAAGLYTKSSPVLQVESQNYDSLIAKSNHTSVREKKETPLKDEYIANDPL